jgi:Flp pilus assembly protein TadD
VLHRDQTNVVALANLATIQMENNRLEAAETNILQALLLAPDDAYSLSILGYLRYRQRQFDAALDALGRAAKFDPQNPQVQNYLGITLAEKGLRGPAETAFRKAIQIEPNYGDAHVNLALIYVGQQPPATELARWHYQRALSAGHTHEPYLEKALQIKN